MQKIKYLILIGLLTKTDLNVKITEIEGKIPSITGLATNSGSTAVENTMPDVSSLVKKTDYNTEISKIEGISVIMLMTNTLLLQNLVN